MAERSIQERSFAKTDTAVTPKGKKQVKAESQELVPARPERISIYICNFSSKEVWVALGATATKEEGIWLKKESGSVCITEYNGPISVITTEGEGTISYAEP